MLGNQVTTIGPRAFKDCSALHRITIPASVTEIAEDAFEGCTNLTVVCEQDSAAWFFALEQGYTVFIR